MGNPLSGAGRPLAGALPDPRGPLQPLCEPRAPPLHPLCGARVRKPILPMAEERFLILIWHWRAKWLGDLHKKQSLVSASPTVWKSCSTSCVNLGSSRASAKAICCSSNSPTSSPSSASYHSFSSSSYICSTRSTSELLRAGFPGALVGCPVIPRPRPSGLVMLEVLLT